MIMNANSIRCISISTSNGWPSVRCLAVPSTMYVDHSLKTVFVFQVSSLSANKHSLNAVTVHKVMNGLHFFDEGNVGYRMKYIYCCTSNHWALASCTLRNVKTDANGTKLKGTKILNDADLEVVTKRFDISIARIHFFPSDTHIVLGITSNSFQSAKRRNTVKGLQTELTRLGLPTKGRKAVLELRLENFMAKARYVKYK